MSEELIPFEELGEEKRETIRTLIGELYLSGHELRNIRSELKTQGVEIESADLEEYLKLWGLYDVMVKSSAIAVSGEKDIEEKKQTFMERLLEKITIQQAYDYKQGLLAGQYGLHAIRVSVFEHEDTIIRDSQTGQEKRVQQIKTDDRGLPYCRTDVEPMELQTAGERLLKYSLLQKEKIESLAAACLSVDDISKLSLCQLETFAKKISGE